MDKVDRLGQLMGVLRRRVLAASKGSRGAGASAPELRESAPRPSVEELRGRIRERLRAPVPDDADRDARASRIFVESVLAWEFGEAMLEDPTFVGLAQRVEEQIAADHGLRRQLRELLEDLAR